MATAKRTRSTTPKTPSNAAAEATRPEVARVSTQAVNLSDVIRVRAYEIYEQRGRQHGRDFDDWLRAEGEVLSRFGARSA